MTMVQENAVVLRHEDIQGGYNLLRMRSPGIAPHVSPGQFVHLLIPHLGESILRRPFSVFKAEGDELAILYKGVGRGTRTLRYLSPGETLGLIGPLGRGFPTVSEGNYPVFVAGGYGMAALYLAARDFPVKGTAFFGGRTSADILCVKEFEDLGWRVIVTTEDGSLGIRGRIPDAFDPWMKEEGAARSPEIFACGPSGMLKAVAERALAAQWPAWVSVDNNMGCGVGACLTCVLKVRDEAEAGWAWARACKEGPVFDARDIVWEDIG